MTGWHACTGFQRDLLVAIAIHPGENETYGLSLKDWLDERYQKPINQSRLYQNLDRLQHRGLVTKHDLDARINAYELTDQGRAALATTARELAVATDHSELRADGGRR